MNCPVDNTVLLISDRNGIEIDYCPKCRGVWLDRGELDKIIERSSGTASIQSRGGSEQSESYDDSYLKRKKKKSFLDDLFDF